MALAPPQKNQKKPPEETETDHQKFISGMKRQKIETKFRFKKGGKLSIRVF